MSDLQKIREMAERYYLTGDFCCSETVLKVILENFKTEMPEVVVSMATGFRHGVGGTGCICGSLAGSTMALGMFFGRYMVKEDDKATKITKLSNEMLNIFKENHKFTCCRVLIKDVTYGFPEQKQLCARFVGEVTEATAKIIIREKGANILK